MPLKHNHTCDPSLVKERRESTLSLSFIEKPQGWKVLFHSNVWQVK